MWTQVGFTAAMGAEGIYADSAVSFSPMLTKWKNEGTFAEAVKAANDADIGNVADNLAKAYYNSTGKPENAAEVDSTRKTAGTTTIRIYSMP
jgi:hypothetical protein